MGERALKITLVGGVCGTVGHVLSINFSGQTRGVVDVSDMDSTGLFREFLSGMADAGDASLELMYDGTASGVADALQTAYALGAVETWTFSYTETTSTWVAAGFIISLSAPGGDLEGAVTQSLTIKFTGVPVYTDAT